MKLTKQTKVMLLFRLFRYFRIFRNLSYSQIITGHWNMRVSHRPVRNVVPVEGILHQANAAVNSWNGGAVNTNLTIEIGNDLLAPVAEDIGDLMHHPLCIADRGAAPFGNNPSAVNLAQRIRVPPDQFILRWNLSIDDFPF